MIRTHSPTSKTYNSNITEWIGIEGAEETGGAPNASSDHGIYKPCQKERVAQVCRHLAAFRNSSGYNRCGSCSKGPLKEEENVIRTRFRVSKEEIRIANKALGVFVRVPICWVNEINGVKASAVTTTTELHAKLHE